MNQQKKAIIIGAGPAGLTAALELQKSSDIQPIILEMSDMIGGISRTIKYKGNRIDIGGHRFFSKSGNVMSWWNEIIPVEPQKNKDKEVVKNDLVMLICNRISRIYYLRKFFDYPISLNMATVLNLGIFRMIAIGYSYVWRSIFPIKEEKSLEDFIINRFGDRLYRTFFKDYTEKVWGVSCKEIGVDWGAQRIKGLSIRKALSHALKNIISSEKSIEQKKIETSLIERFLYPKFGPGQLWEEVARRVESNGGVILMNLNVNTIITKHNNVVSIEATDKDGNVQKIEGDYFFSTMPVKDLINGMTPSPTVQVLAVANGLMYRDFITVGLLIDKLKVKDLRNPSNGLIKDNWIYIQEPDVKLGRLQIFNNWSPHMVNDPSKVWIGLEYFCNEDDELWSQTDTQFSQFAIKELAQIDIIEEEDVIDSVVIKVPKTYPGYFGSYKNFDTIRAYTDNIENLFLIGRNGMHRYNNMDHSMLSAMKAVENINNGIKDKSNIWNVNIEDEYHEEK